MTEKVVVVVHMDAVLVDELEPLLEPDPAGIKLSLEELLLFLAHTAAAGVVRPGSWERGWITQATGWPYR